METLGPLLEQEGYSMYYASNKVVPLVRMLHMLLSIVRLRKIVRIVLIDVYSTSAFYYAYFTANLCKFLGLPYVAILHGGNLPERIKHSPKKSNSIFNYSHGNIALSTYMQQAMQQYGYRVETIPNSIAIEEYRSRGVTQVKGSLLWVRSFHKIYNPQMAISLIHSLSKKYPEARLTMVGPDKDGSLGECLQLAKQLGVADKINFTGLLTKQEWLSLAADHDVFVNTSNFDNMPFSLVEAMATGLPIVSTNAGGIPSLITNGENGLMVHKDDVVAMHNAIESLLNDDAMATRLSEQSRITAEKFDWDTVKHKWHNLINTAV